MASFVLLSVVYSQRVVVIVWTNAKGDFFYLHIIYTYTYYYAAYTIKYIHCIDLFIYQNWFDTFIMYNMSCPSVSFIYKV